MVIKMGYLGKSGIEMWRYLESKVDLKVVDVLQEKYYVKRVDPKTSDDQEIKFFFREYKSPHKKLSDGTTSLDIEDREVDVDSIWFDSSLLKQFGQIFWLNVIFVTDSHDRVTSYACLADTVFIMNENGKTVDRH